MAKLSFIVDLKIISKLMIAFLLVINLPDAISQEQDTAKAETNKSKKESSKERVIQYPSLMWEITGPGMKKPSYLYGSMHVSRKLAFHLGDTFFMAIRNVDVVALESNPAEWMGHYTQSPYYNRRITTQTNHGGRYNYRNFYRDLFFPDMPEVSTFTELLSKRYNVMNHMLYRKSESMSDFEEMTYLDLFIFQAGAKLGKQVTGMEDFEESRRMVEEAETPPLKRDKNQKVTREQSTIRYRYGEMMEEAYRKGDLDMLDSISRMLDPYPKYHTWMIVKRNEVMVESIDSVIRSGKSIFAAAGAAHLPGDSGMIELLRQKGYTVRPVTRTINRSQNKAKEKIDNQFVKLPMKRWTSADGVVSADLPGEFYSSVLFSDHGEYFYPDMVNGSFYVLKRLPSYGPLRGHTPEAIKARFDSLIYEFIPGKINDFKEFSLNGNPAYDIRATITRGDIQRYVIAFTPMEVVVLKMSGPAKYMKKEKAADQFFKSISLNINQGAQWTKVEPKQRGFSVMLPPYHIIDTTQTFSRGSKDLVAHAYDYTDSSYYLIIKGSYFDFNYIEEDTFELEFMAEQLAKQFELDVVDQQFIQVSGHPAYAFTLKNLDDPARSYDARIVICGPAYYLLLASGANQEKRDRFFSNFSVAPPVYEPTGFYTWRDTTLLFTVQTVVDPPIARRDRFDYYYYGDDEEDRSHQSERKETSFYNHRSTELINVDYFKSNKYSGYKSLEKFYEREMRSMNPDSTMIIRNKITSDSGLVNTMYVELTDTNSSRMIMHKVIQKHGVVFRLKTVSDTITGPSSFVTTFFETFAPFQDTLVGWDLFADKGDLWLHDLVSEDSTTRAQARQSISTIFFRDSNAPLLMERIKNPRYDEHTFRLRRQMISDLGTLEDPAIPGFLADYYKAIGDTVTMQFSILRALGRQKNKEAAIAFLQCLKTDLPLASSESDIESLFTGFRDSLEIARLLFPEILTYTRYREYENHIYSLMATLLDSNLIQKNDYRSEYAALYRNARDYWKRHQAREEEEQDKKSEYYSGGSSWSTFGGSYATPLRTYLKLILPFYDEQEQVRNLVAQVLNSQTTALQIEMTIQMLKSKLPVPDGHLTRLSTDPFSMVIFYRRLAFNELLDHFDTTTLNQQRFSHAMLLRDANLKQRDSLLFIEKQYVKTLNHEGYVYFFKRKREKERSWSLLWVGIHPMDSTKVVYDNYERNSSGTRIYDNDVMSELIEKEMKKIRILGRKRASGMSFEKNIYQFVWY